MLIAQLHLQIATKIPSGLKECVVTKRRTAPETRKQVRWLKTKPSTFVKTRVGVGSRGSSGIDLWSSEMSVIIIGKRYLMVMMIELDS